MNILYITTGLGLGGAEIITINIANGMASRGHKVMILSMIGRNEIQSKIDERIEVKSLGICKNPFSLINGIRQTKRIIKNFKPDVVHANMVHANIFSRILRLFIPMKKLICTAHNKDEGGWLRMMAYRLTDRLSDLNTNVSKEATDYFISHKWFSAGKSICVYNGINLATFHKDCSFRNEIRNQYGIDSNDFLFLNVGRLTEAKDQNNLLHAFSKIECAKLMIVGQGEKKDDLKKLAKDLNIDDRVVLAGAHPDIQAYYNAADCFVLSSAWEGFGLVLAEAMACGLPVISTDAGGCAEVVDQPQYMVPIKDEEKLRDKMIEIMNKSISERNDIGSKNSLIAKKYDIHSIIDKWESLYMSKYKETE